VVELTVFTAIIPVNCLLRINQLSVAIIFDKYNIMKKVKDVILKPKPMFASNN